MAYDKVVDSAVLDADLKTVADSIRAKGGTSAQLSFPDGMAAAVAAIQTGGGNAVIQPLAVTANGTYTAPAGVDGYSPVTVNVAGGGGGSDVETELITRTITEYQNSGLTQIGDYAFAGCRKLVVVTCPLVTSIGADAFFGCGALAAISFQATKTTGSSSFQGCGALVSVRLPAATSIGASSFYRCEALTDADFPVATSIAMLSFAYCFELTALILRSETRTTLSNTNAFTSTPIASGTGYIYVPATLVDSYKAATNWSTYAGQFRALEDYTVDGTITGELDRTKI